MWVAMSGVSGTPRALMTSNTISPQAAADAPSDQFTAPYIRLPAWWSMLMMKPPNPDTPVRASSLHSITITASPSAGVWDAISMRSTPGNSK